MARGIFVLLFRGINVAGKNVVRMETLRVALTDAGFEDVSTYIQSGNVVFSSDGDTATLSRRVDIAFNQAFGFSSRPTLRSLEEWMRVVLRNPFPAEAADDGRRVHAVLLDGRVSDESLHALEALAGTERLQATEGVLYLHTPDGFGVSKVAEALDRVLKLPWTARNWNTVLKLQEMTLAAQSG